MKSLLQPFQRPLELSNLDDYNIILESNTAIDQRVLNKPAVSRVGAIWHESDALEQNKGKHIQLY